MPRYGGVAIPMQQSLNEEQKSALKAVSYVIGDADRISSMIQVAPLAPFSEEVIAFLGDVSKELMLSREAKAYPDVITLAFWLRKASLLKYKEQFSAKDGNVRIGRGVAFHIAPSNVSVNYAYSLFTGLMTGNANIVRIPSKDFPQISIINEAVETALDSHVDMKPYVVLVRYEHDRKVNDVFSELADTRIIWGGDSTITELRKSPLHPRGAEITFADRYSLAVIDSDAYLETNDRARIAEAFYNDTYLTDQNACTSPRIVVWMGRRKAEAKEEFWSRLHKLVKDKYSFQAIQGINKLASSYLMAASRPGTKIEPHEDNYIIRVNVPHCTADLMDLKDNSGYFLEYDCEEILEIRDLCDDKRCQTIGYLGEKEMLRPLIASGVKGVDRVVPLGKTMDFELLWDGYNLYERLTRVIRIC